MQIIPAINATDFERVKRMILQATEFVIPAGGWIHLDIADGKFTANKTWGNPADLGQSALNFSDLHAVHFEIHLMVNDPESVVTEWLKAGVGRVIVHMEAIRDAEAILEQCQAHGVQAMLSSNPETPPDALLPFLQDFNAFQVLAVKPGLAGQAFKPEAVKKIKFLRERAPNATIEVDGGITKTTGKLAKDAGADILVSASYIWGSKNQRKAFEELMNL